MGWVVGAGGEPKAAHLDSKSSAAPSVSDMN